MNKKDLFFKMLVQNMCFRWGADFVILFCRYDLKMTEQELTEIFKKEDVEKSKRFTLKQYKDSVKLSGGIFSSPVTILK